MYWVIRKANSPKGVSVNEASNAKIESFRVLSLDCSGRRERISVLWSVGSANDRLILDAFRRNYAPLTDPGWTFGPLYSLLVSGPYQILASVARSDPGPERWQGKHWGKERWKLIWTFFSSLLLSNDWPFSMAECAFWYEVVKTVCSCFNSLIFSHKWIHLLIYVWMCSFCCCFFSLLSLGQD